MIINSLKLFSSEKCITLLSIIILYCSYVSDLFVWSKYFICLLWLNSLLNYKPLMVFRLKQK